MTWQLVGVVGQHCYFEWSRHASSKRGLLAIKHRPLTRQVDQRERDCHVVELLAMTDIGDTQRRTPTPSPHQEC